MATVERQASGETHEVFNQPSPLEDYNPFDADRPLVEALRREGAEWAEDRARELAAICGSHQTIRWGFEANEKQAAAATHDRYGNRDRRGRVRQLLARADADRRSTHGLHASPWRDPGPAPTSPARRCSCC